MLSRTKHYPVMYLLDGEMHFHHATGAVQFLATNGRIPEMIVIGISNTDRKRDLTPSTGVASDLKEDPTAGGADRFLKFMVDELAPGWRRITHGAFSHPRGPLTRRSARYLCSCDTAE